MTEEIFSKYMEGQLKSALSVIEMPDSYYDKAIVSYESISRELTSRTSELAQYDPEIILQGSIKIGTAIKPITEDGSYDVDMVCNLKKLTKKQISQQELKSLVGNEIKAYAQEHRMSNEPRNGKRCWTLDYVDEANFHIDILPTIDDTKEHRYIMAQKSISHSNQETYLALTDKRHPLYKSLCNNWFTTNPKGYAEWFLNIANLENKRILAKSASIEKIKVQSRKLPLQRYIQLLKRHRDIYLSNQSEEGDIKSIVITTLAAMAYEEIERTGNWFNDFSSMVRAMPRFIMAAPKGYRLINPTDPLENFLEDWDEAANSNFLKWHASVIEDLTPSPKGVKKRLFNHYIHNGIRRSLGIPPHESILQSPVRTKLDSLSHHKQHGFTEIEAIRVKISATKKRNGGMAKAFGSGDPLPKGISLDFYAEAEGINEFEVQWQVTNDGLEATRAGCLRGDLYPSFHLSNGKKKRSETTSYVGQHYVECLLIKDNVVYGRSEPFVVNIVDQRDGRTNW